MDIYDVVKSVNGEIVSNRAQYRDETGARVVIGKVSGGELAFTPAGVALAEGLVRASKPRKPRTQPPPPKDE